MFDEVILDALSDEPITALRQLCLHFINETQKKSDDLEYEDYLNAFGTFQAIAEAHDFDFAYPVLDGPRAITIGKISEFFRRAFLDLDGRLTRLLIEKAKADATKRIKKGFKYEFSDADMRRIQELINELRDRVSNSEIIDADHKSRLLRRLEAVQAELHKRVSDLDRFWGLIGDAGVVLGKFGKDVKPIVDRIKEIAQITWQTQARSEQLPTGSKLPKLNDDGEDV